MLRSRYLIRKGKEINKYVNQGKSKKFQPQHVSIHGLLEDDTDNLRGKEHRQRQRSGCKNPFILSCFTIAVIVILFTAIFLTERQSNKNHYSKETNRFEKLTLAKLFQKTRSYASDNHQHKGQLDAIVNSCWLTLDIVKDFGAVGDNATDDTHAFRDAFQKIHENFNSKACSAEQKQKAQNDPTNQWQQRVGGEVIIPHGKTFQTLPFNITSNSILTVHGNIVGIANVDIWPKVPALPSYGRCPDMKGKFRRHALIHAFQQENILIRGDGIIDGGGWYWYPFFKDMEGQKFVGRPHLMEINNCTNVEITGVTLKNSAFWTLHPVYCKNVHIHHMKIDAPSCRLYKCPNTDGIDIDSSENVLVEYNHINVGDDHVTVLAGKLKNRPNLYRTPPTRNVTVQHNILGTGMGLAIGSSTAGGVSDVLYYNNTMFAEEKGQYGQGVHIKLRDRFGGYVRNVAWVNNVIHSVNQAFVFEFGYQGNTAWKKCDKTSCPEVRDILVKNLTVLSGKPGSLNCYEQRPCENITLEDIHFHDPRARVGCNHIHSGATKGKIFPETLFDQCVNLTRVK
jgi:hypothetical protein